MAARRFPGFLPGGPDHCGNALMARIKCLHFRHIVYPAVQPGLPVRAACFQVAETPAPPSRRRFRISDFSRGLTMATKNRSKKAKPILAKCATGVHGLDEVTFGGLPRGRPTLICGGAGSGKTLLAMEFLVRGALEQGEPGVFVAFEETGRELAENVASLGFDLEDLAARRQLLIDHVQIERAQAGETGEYSLDGLFARLGHAIDSIGARRVALDTIEVLFAGLGDSGILRAELARLFRWLKDKGVTALVTAERGDGSLTRHGLEEYVSDCVIALDQRVSNQVATRRLRIVKYRGTAHGTNEYPFLIDAQGFSVVPLTSLGLEHPALTQRIASGVPKLDAMLGGGYYRGSTVLASGEAGTGKSSLAAHFAGAACGRGERCLYFAFEESPEQIMRNMRSIGIDLEPWVRKGLLRFHTARPASFGLETHLAAMHTRMDEFKPRCVVIDPVSGFDLVGGYSDVKVMLTRLVDMMKMRGITALMTDLTAGGDPANQTDVGISSLIDTWLVLRNLEQAGERNRGLYIIKSRGMKHSNQVREFMLTARGVDLLDVRLGPEGVLLGSARVADAARVRDAALRVAHEAGRRRQALERKRKAVEAQIDALRAEFEEERQEVEAVIVDAEQVRQAALQAQAELAEKRSGPGEHGKTAKRKTSS